MKKILLSCSLLLCTVFAILGYAHFYKQQQLIKRVISKTEQPKKTPATIVKSEDPEKAKAIFVINRNGTKAYSSPNEKSEVLEEYQPGEWLKIINDLGRWIKAKNINGTTVFVKKEDFGTEAQIPMENIDLNKVYIDENDSVKFALPNTSIKIERITFNNYNSMKKKAVSYFTADTNRFKNVKGKLKVITTNKTVEYVDDFETPDAEDHYEYIGQYNELNKYVIDASHNEWGQIIFIDKTNGREQFLEDNFPYLSNNKKFLISCGGEYYNQGNFYAILQVREVNKDTTENTLAEGFKNWLPVDYVANSNSMFWGNDDCFYLPIVPANATELPYKNFEGNYHNNHYRYIRIRIKGISKGF